MNTEESLDLLRRFAFGLWEEEDGEEDAQHTEAAEHPKGSRAADSVLNINKS